MKHFPINKEKNEKESGGSDAGKRPFDEDGASAVQQLCDRRNADCH